MLTLVGTEYPALIAAILGHPLTPRLTGTVAVGLGTTSPWLSSPSEPRIVVLHNVTTLDRIARAHLSSADGIVVSGSSSVAASIREAARSDALCAVALPRAKRFLKGASTADSGAAWEEVAQHAALAAALGIPPAPDTAENVADLVIELVIAAGN